MLIRGGLGTEFRTPEAKDGPLRAIDAMTTLRTLAVHDIVQRAYPRPPPEEKDEVAMATGRAIDGVLTELAYELRQGRRPGGSAMVARAGTILDDALADAAVTIPPEERERILTQVRGTLKAYRDSEIFGLARPRTRVIVIGNRVGIYAQPDFWDGRRRFFELKSYRAIPMPTDVALQMRLFQLAYPGFESVLLCLNRHTTPVEVTSARIPPPTEAEGAAAIRLAYDLALEFGEEKVREYMVGPFLPYDAPGVAP